jgi:hypothetical protein
MLTKSSVAHIDDEMLSLVHEMQQPPRDVDELYDAMSCHEAAKK